MFSPFIVAYTGSPIVSLHSSDLIVKAELMEPLVVHVWDKNDKYTRVVIPKGFRTNLASTPRLLWWIPGFSPLSRSELPAILHDWLYSKECPFKFTRQESDQIFRSALEFAGENVFIRNAYYAGVRIGGTSRWRK